MMLFRNAARPIGLGFKTLSTPSTVTSSPRFLKVAVSTRCQTRLSSTASTLTPPWQVSDLSATEQRYYAEFGPDYINHVSDKKQRANIVRAREAREKAATHFQQQLGEDWYSIVIEANARIKKLDQQVKSEFIQEREKLDLNRPSAEYDRLRVDFRAWHKVRLEKIRQIQRDIREERRK